MMVLGLVGARAVGTQLGLEGAHRRAVTVSPTPRADGDPDALVGSEERELLMAEHEVSAIKGAEVFATSRIIDIEVHRAGV